MSDKAKSLAASTGARLVMPSQTLLEGMEYLPSTHYVPKADSVPYLCGHSGRVTTPAYAAYAHHSARRHHE